MPRPRRGCSCSPTPRRRSRSATACGPGAVHEFRPGGATPTNLTTTEISGPGDHVAVERKPAAGAVGRAARPQAADDDAPPVIDDDSFGGFDAADDGIDFYESLEGMRVQVNDAVAAGPTNDFGATRDRGAARRRRRPRCARPAAGSSSRPATSTPSASCSTTAHGRPAAGRQHRRHVPGPDGRRPRLRLRQLQARRRDRCPGRRGGLAREDRDAGGRGELTVATFNVENLDPGDPPTKFAELADLVVDNLRAPDCRRVEEIQDDNGATNDATISAATNLDTLVVGDRGGRRPHLPVPPDRPGRTIRTAANRAATSGSASCSAPTAAGASSTAPAARRPPPVAVVDGPAARTSRPAPVGSTRPTRRSTTAASPWPPSSTAAETSS